MESISVDDIISACQGSPSDLEGSVSFTGISTDSRKIKKGDLYIPLIGETFDGHDFIDKAFEAGARAVLTQREVPKDGRSYIKVQDTLKALQDIARHYKERFMIPFVAVTGSSGKTTTKDMIAAVLGGMYNVMKTEGNYNNAIGVPLTLLNLDSHHEVAVIEMGMNSLGEIEVLADIVRPDVGVISNVGTAHIEKLGSRENILKAKLELFTYFDEENIAIVNGDNDMLTDYESDQYRVIKYGLGNHNDITAYNVREKGEEGVEFNTVLEDRVETFIVPIPGIHNVYNALSALAVGMYLGVPIQSMKRGLMNFKPSKMRMDIFTTSGGIKIINDVYNANPESMIATIDVLKSFKGEGGRTAAILGNMLELGDTAKEGHYRVGKHAAEVGIDIVIGVGDMAKDIAQGALDFAKNNTQVFAFGSKEEAVEGLLDILKSGDSVLLKGSRGMKMEHIVDFLRERG